MYNTPNFLDFILLNVGYSKPNENWNWKKIYSPFARIYYVIEGRAKTYIKGQAYTLEPDYLYLTPPFTWHDDESKDSFSLYYIHFYEETTNKESIFDTYDFPIGIKATTLDLDLAKRLLEINPNRNLKYFDPHLYDNPSNTFKYIADNSRMPLQTIVESKGILCQFMSRFFISAKVKSGNQDVRISNCIKYIHENIDKNISTSQLADIACITEDHFIRIFKRNMNYTPLKYINLKKIEKAQLLLLTTEMPIREISLEISIDNISYFNRIFKQYTKQTPSEYRMEYKTKYDRT